VQGEEAELKLMRIMVFFGRVLTYIRMAQGEVLLDYREQEEGLLNLEEELCDG
jgi:hypothetical protein